MKKDIIQKFEDAQLEKLKSARKEIPCFKAGDSVSVKYKISEGGNTRLQAFQGVVIARSKSSNNYDATFTVRKMSSGIGVERNFALNSPLIDTVEVTKRGVVRRAKLYYLRKLTGKAARIKEKLDFFDGSKSEAKKAKAEEKKSKAKKSEEEKVKRESIKVENSESKAGDTVVKSEDSKK